MNSYNLREIIGYKEREGKSRLSFIYFISQQNCTVTLYQIIAFHLQKSYIQKSKTRYFSTMQSCKKRMHVVVKADPESQVLRPLVTLGDPLL